MTAASVQENKSRGEAESISTRSIDSGIKLSVPTLSCFISDCPSVAWLKATYAEPSHVVLSCPHQKAFIFNLLCVLIWTTSEHTIEGEATEDYRPGIPCLVCFFQYGSFRFDPALQSGLSSV